jgi:SAM-dependent methyltransferase
MNSVTDSKPSTLPEPSSTPVPAPAPVGPCPACGHEQGRTLFRVPDRLGLVAASTCTVVECGGCRLLRLEPWPGAAAVRRNYPPGFWLTSEAHSKIEDHFRKFRLRDQVNFTKSALRKAAVAGPVLEIASRGGWFLSQIVSKTRPVVALDFDIAAAGASWQHMRVPAVCGTLTSAPFAPKTFAAVTMFQVLEHLFDPAAHLEAARKLLKPGGRLIIQVPNASCWQFLLLGERWSGLDAPRHLIHYRAHDLEILLDRCGFGVERVKYFSLADNPSGLASSLAPGLDPESRRLRHLDHPEPHGTRLAKDLLHHGLALAALPFALLEAACHAGSTVMMEARVLD